MVDQPFDLTISSEGPRIVVAVSGEVDVATAPRLRECVVEALAVAQGHVVEVEMSAITFLDSTGLGVLVGVLKRARNLGGDIVLRHPTDTVRNVLELTQLDRSFNIKEA